MAVQRTLRLAGRAPGVEDEERVVVADGSAEPGGLVVGRGFDQGLVAAVASGSVLEPVLDGVDHAGQLGGDLGVLALGDVDLRGSPLSMIFFSSGARAASSSAG